MWNLCGHAVEVLKRVTVEGFRYDLFPGIVQYGTVRFTFSPCLSVHLAFFFP